MLERNRARTELLDQALAGQSAEVKARVLNILLRYNIDVENEFFLIFTAIGHLLAIVEESPENWRSLFDDFERELDGWATQNLRTLEAINRQSEHTERMGQSFRELVRSTTNLSSETATSLIRLNKLDVTLNGLASKLSQTESHSSSLLNRFKKTDQRIERLEKLVTLTSACSLGLLLALLVGGGLSYQRIANQNEFTQVLQGRTQEKTGWLLEKANRQECANGIKPASDPQCRQYR